MRLKRYAAAVAIGAAALAAPAAANAATPAPPAAPAMNPPGFLFSFTPPSVGPLSVDIGATIINGQIISQPVHVLVQPTKLDTSTWTLPSESKPVPAEADSGS
jgi:hypothetical protein